MGSPAATESSPFVVLRGRERAAPPRRPGAAELLPGRGRGCLAVRRDTAGGQAGCSSPPSSSPALSVLARSPVCSMRTGRVGKSGCKAVTEECHCAKQALRVPGWMSARPRSSECCFPVVLVLFSVKCRTPSDVFPQCPRSLRLAPRDPVSCQLASCARARRPLPKPSR